MSNQTRTHFGIAGGWQYVLALNNRQLATLDTNGSPIMKDAPQLVGAYKGVPSLWEQRTAAGSFHGTSLNQLISPDSGWNLQDAYDINDNGAIAADGWYQPKDSQGNPVGSPQWRSCLLLPVELKQLNYPVSPGTTDLGTAQQMTILPGQTAYITGSPQMPQLQVTLGGISIAGFTVDWRMQVTSERTERDTKDDVTIPQTSDPSVITAGIDQPWLIYNYYAPPAAFFGGNCTVSFRIRNSAGAYVTDEAAFSFKIRGKNPKDADAKSYIQNTQGDYRFAWAMVQHESRQTIGGVDRIYNQFNAGGSSKELPNFSGNYPTEDGWGMAQLDKPLGLSASTVEVYNWQQNISKFYDELADKQATQQRFFDAVAAAYAGNAEAQSPPFNFIPSGTATSLTALEAGIITLYNGAAGCPTSTLGGTTYRNPWTFDPNASAGQKWQYHANVNNYLYKVIHDEFEGQLNYQE